MSGQIKKFIDQIVEQRAHGNPVLAQTTHTKLLLKGIDPARYSAGSPDDPAVLAQLKRIASDLGVSLT